MVTELYKNACTLLIGLFEENGVESRVELLADILEQHGLAELDGVLHSSQVVRVGQLDYVEFSATFHLFYPLICLTLRIDTQWPPSRFKYDNTVLQRE